jgi:5-methylcytosine-specific restriction protein A
MADDKIGERLLCAQCGAGFERQSNRGREPARCRPCAKERSKAQVQEALARLTAQGYFRDRQQALPKWERPTGECAICGTGFIPHVPSQRYCAKSCRAKADSRKVSEARPLYRYARWLRIRKAQLSKEPDCRFCGLAGIKTRATVCDHVHPHRGSVEAFWSGPFQSLCSECHNRDKQRMERRAA